MGFGTLEYLKLFLITKNYYLILFLFMCMCGYLLVSVGTKHVQNSLRLEEGIGSSGTPVTVVRCLMCVPGAEAGSFTRAASLLRHLSQPQGHSSWISFQIAHFSKPLRNGHLLNFSITSKSVSNDIKGYKDISPFSNKLAGFSSVISNEITHLELSHTTGAP